MIITFIAFIYLFIYLLYWNELFGKQANDTEAKALIGNLRMGNF